MIRKLLALALVSCCTAAVSGCAVQSNDEPASPQTSTKDEQLFSTTRVMRNADGTETVTVTWETPAQRKVEADIRLAREALRKAGRPASELGTTQQAIQHDTSCAGTSMWLYDVEYGPEYGIGNRICFGGTGSIYLYNYCRTWSGSTCTDYWSQSVRSAWSGEYDAQLQYDLFSCVYTMADVYTKYNTLTQCGQASEELYQYVN